MSNRHKRKGGQKFIKLDAYIMRSEAWKHLTPVARCAYLELKLRYDGLNNGAIGLGCRELAFALNMGRDTAARALQELQDKGFITKAKPSSFNTKNRTATEWRITEETCHETGLLPTKEFMRWQPAKVAQSVRSDALRQQEKKSQSDISDAQSDPTDALCKQEGENGPRSPIHQTVKADFAVSQSDPSDTYRSTRGCNAKVEAPPPSRRSAKKREQLTPSGTRKQ